MPEIQQGDRAHNHPAVAAPHTLLSDLHTPWWKRVTEITLLLVMMTGDVVTLFLTMNIVFEESPWISGMLTAALVGAAVLMMEQAGSSARRVKAKDAPYGWLRVQLLIGAWAAIGLAAFTIRWNAANDLAATGSEIADAGATQSSTGSLSALLLLALYIASGVVAYHLGFTWHQPVKAQMKQYEKSRSKARTAHKAAAERSREAAGALAFAENAIEQCRVTSDVQIAKIDVLAEQLREHARLFLSAQLKDPARTSGVTRGGAQK